MMTKFATEQIKKFFNTGQWALKLIFIVVLCELGIVMGAMVGLAGELDENDSNNIKHIMGMIATKSFALYAAEKAGAKEKYLIENFKQLFLMITGNATQKYGTSLEQQQQVLQALADILIEIFFSESALLRTLKNHAILPSILNQLAPKVDRKRNQSGGRMAPEIDTKPSPKVDTEKHQKPC